MARAIPAQPSATSPTSSDTYTIDIINLNNLLTRLEQNIFASSTEYKLLRQSYLHCARIGANIDYAQTLLNNIERSLPSVKSPATRHERTTDLAKKRARWTKIKDRFDSVVEDVERRYRDDEDVVEEEEEIIDDDDAALWEGIIPISEKKSDDHDIAVVEIEAEDEKHPSSRNIPTPDDAANELRQRHRGYDNKADTVPPSTTAVIASGTSPSTTPKPSTTPTNNDIAKEATLHTHRAEQENLTTSLLNLAGQLKASSEAFQTSLEQEKGILDRAVEGLDRNLTGMEAAGKRMGVLRRMTEGRGWWGRMMMYAWIFGLWFIALAIVYLGPKLRF